MKKNVLLGGVAFLFLGTTINAQVTTPTNNANFFPQFVGYNGTGVWSKPLDIRNNFTQPINFFTANNQRMNITATGLVSMSNGLNAPLSLLHVNSNGNAIGGEVFRTSSPGTTTSWRMELGTAPNAERFRITTNTNNVELGSVQNGSLSFYTRNIERVTVLGDNDKV